MKDPDSVPQIKKGNSNRRCPIKFFEEEKDGKKQVVAREVEDEENIIQTLTGTDNKELASNIICTALTALPNSLNEAMRYNLIFQTLADNKPRDAHEARLSVQAIVLYNQAMDFLQRARNVLFDEGTFAKDHWHVILMKSATKLLELHGKTVEALMRYRQRGEQRIVVQHVTVQDGGKAIVGNVMPRGDQQ